MRIVVTASWVILVGCLTISCLTITVTPSWADVIDFETGFARLDPISTVVTSTNTVTISTSGGPSATPFVAQVGTTPKDAFETIVDGVILGDTPEGGNPGSFFLTDGAGNGANFVFGLERPVGEFSVDIYDYVGDGGAATTDYVTLNAYSDLDRINMVATDVYIVPGLRPMDGLTVPLAVSASSIAALTLEFSTLDRGTGIDNIQFVTIPEPAGMALAALALATFLACPPRRRR